MAEFGWTVPCLVAEDGELIAGHGRVLAATQLGLTEAPVIVLGHLTEAQRRAYRMAAAMDKIAGSMTRGYAARSGKSKEDIAALMAAETWFDAQDALDAGLATRMAEPVRIAASSDIGRFRNAPMALAELGDAESAATGDDIVPDENDVAPATTDPAPQQQTRSPCSRNKGKVAGFHSAHSGTIPPLPWHNFAPPFSLEPGTRTSSRPAVTSTAPTGDGQMTATCRITDAQEIPCKNGAVHKRQHPSKGSHHETVGSNTDQSFGQTVSQLPGRRLRGDQILSDLDQHSVQPPRLAMDGDSVVAIIFNLVGPVVDNTRSLPPHPADKPGSEGL
jgi:hypothetical protein